VQVVVKKFLVLVAAAAFTTGLLAAPAVAVADTPEVPAGTCAACWPNDNT
jgi:hypothetical protein